MSTVKNKAFTIVELVIVIFVLAVLAAVLIPTFSNVIRRANVAKDTQLVRNLNTALALEAAVGNRPATASVAAEMCGCDKKNIVSAVSGNVILWDSVNNVFCYCFYNRLPLQVDALYQISMIFRSRIECCSEVEPCMQSFTKEREASITTQSTTNTFTFPKTAQ